MLAARAKSSAYGSFHAFEKHSAELDKSVSIIKSVDVWS